MKTKFDPYQNYLSTKQKAGYVNRIDATQADYDRIGFMSGLEVHQQLLTEKKLFCRCPAGIYHDDENFDAEVIRHMRPTLSELGEYDGTALMEFKTRKNIIYRLNNENACTYEVDDTPPFLINDEALEIALEITILSKFNVVGEVHITRKQYLDGSIPTGFQRTAILGVEGEIQLRNKKVRLIQLSIEEDSCREISDIGHLRIYKTDRLGMPLIETVTYPDMVNPDEVMEACDYIRFLNRSTGKVRIGNGAGRQDVNVSCRGGTRVEIKGVAHTKWIPELTHNECFRQWCLLLIKDELLKRVSNPENWKMSYAELDYNAFDISNPDILDAKEKGEKLYAVNLPHFKGLLSHFTQPGKMFADEISERLKVIACIEKPHMVHTEMFETVISNKDMEIIMLKLESDELNDAVIVFWGPEEDIETALETIEERCQMAFDRVPNETRKCFQDGTTIFERVLPGADRMYPDTDSKPIPLASELIDRLSQNVPQDICERINKMIDWGIPEDTYTYILSKNLYPLLDRIVGELGLDAKQTGVFLGHTLKYIEGQYNAGYDFDYDKIIDLIKFTKENNIHFSLIRKMLPVMYEHPKMDFDSILATLKFKKKSKEDIIELIDLLVDKFNKTARRKTRENAHNWIMGQLRPDAEGNICLTELQAKVAEKIDF
jgi:glutamyl-tRNA(Gln) amidotransferase subunit E